MEQWNEAKQKFHDFDDDSAIGPSFITTTRSEFTEV